METHRKHCCSGRPKTVQQNSKARVTRQLYCNQTQRVRKQMFTHTQTQNVLVYQTEKQTANRQWKHYSLKSLHQEARRCEFTGCRRQTPYDLSHTLSCCAWSGSNHFACFLWKKVKERTSLWAKKEKKSNKRAAWSRLVKMLRNKSRRALPASGRLMQKVTWQRRSTTAEDGG